jgi:hypothetical protein
MRNVAVTGPVRIRVLIASAAVLMAAAAAIVIMTRPAPVDVTEAEVSLDGDRLALVLASCHADLQIDVREATDSVSVTVTRSDRDLLAGDDCQDIVYVELDQALGSRELRDARNDTTVATRQPAAIGEQHWPFDRSRVSEAEYDAALRAMVECLEQGDPDVSAYIVQLLDWKTYEWTKPPVDGTISIDDELLDGCERAHLEPLR